MAIQSAAEWKKKRQATTVTTAPTSKTAGVSNLPTNIPLSSATLLRNVLFGMLPSQTQGSLRKAQTMAPLQAGVETGKGLAFGVPEMALNLLKFPANVALGAARTLPGVGTAIPQELPVLGASPNLRELMVGGRQQAEEVGFQGPMAALVGGGTGTALALASLLGAKSLVGGGLGAMRRVGKVSPKAIPLAKEPLVKPSGKAPRGAETIITRQPQPTEYQISNIPPALKGEYGRMRPQPVAEPGFENVPPAMRPKPVKAIVPLPKPPVEAVKPGEVFVPDITQEKVTVGTRQRIQELYEPMIDTVRKFGKPGQEYATRLERMRAKEFTMRGQMDVQIDKAFPKLNPAEQKNVFAVVERGEGPMNEKVGQAVVANRNFATRFLEEGNKRGILVDDNTGRVIGNPQTYIHHTLNEAGIKVLDSKPSTFFDKLATANKMTPAEARILWDRYISRGREPVAGFERGREFLIPEEYLETDLTKIWKAYNRQASKRFAMAEEFGKKLEVADQLAGQIGEVTGDQTFTNFTRELTDLVAGRHPWQRDTGMRRIADKLVRQQVVSKLSVMTTVPNLQQGYLASSSFQGQRFALYGLVKAFTKDGATWAKETGLLSRGWYGRTGAGFLDKVWEWTTGFPASEDLNFRIATNATRAYVTNLFNQLKKNPNNPKLTAELDYYGVDWQSALKAGSLTKDQLLQASYTFGQKSIFPKLAEMTPKWAQNPAGKVIYQFQHYSLQQPRFLTSAFQIGKLKGVQAITTYALLSSLIGEIPADLWAAIRGEKRSEELLPRMLENSLSAGYFGALYQVPKTLLQYGGAGRFLGPTITGGAEAVQKIGTPLTKGQFGEAGVQVGRQYLKGNLPFLPPTPMGALLERGIPKE